MANLVAAAPIDGAAVLPDALIEQYVKPGDDQAMLIDSLRLTAFSLRPSPLPAWALSSGR